MKERIQELARLTLEGKMHPIPNPPEYDREDILLDRIPGEVKRLCEYIENQNPVLNEYCALTGLMFFDGSCVGDAFNVSGHKAAREVMDQFYLKKIHNLSVMEWQHATGDYKRVLAMGLDGVVGVIDESLQQHTQKEEVQFLQGLKKVCASIVKWANKCADAAWTLSQTVENPEYKENLQQLSAALRNVPQKPASSFYEAVLCINLCYSFNPDSFGTLDRYLQPYYDHDIANNIITREQAGEYLQEFLLTPQAYNTPGGNWSKGGQSHFCIGGYTLNGEDGFTDLSRLIVESLMALPTFIPEITFRWTKKTSREDFAFVMDAERKDASKRIAFTNDEKRLKCLTEICKIPYERAIEYTMVGCNELTFPGAVSASNSKGNLMHCIDTLFHKHSEVIEDLPTFDAFYEVFEKEMYRDLDIVYDYDDKYNLCRSRDYNYVSSIFFEGCIEHAKGVTNGGNTYAVSGPMIIGLMNVIDSLIVVKQFVYDEKCITMKELITALQANWEGYEDLRRMIGKKATFFGNDDDRSNEVARRIYHSFYLYLKDKKTLHGYPIVMGDHTGYNEHFKWFGTDTGASPDGRYNGDVLKFGLSQSGGYDRNGLTALLNAVATVDEDAIACGSTVTNITVDEELVKNDAYFDKLISMLQTYFENGGVHFQLNYVSREELLDAKANPEDHQNLRVRVTGFSEYFVKLKESFQDSIIDRTTQR